MHRVIFFFFFLSGFSSLVFEVIWARMLQQVFGTTSFAISTLLTAFMAGLAIGSFLGGKLARRGGDQLRLYGILEGSIGAYALLVPLLLESLPGLYGFLFSHFIEDFYLFSLLRFLAVFLILLIPTTLMGATLPLVSQWIADRERYYQPSLGFLYGANTFGACMGTLLAGFLLLPSLGLSATNWIFALVNFGLAALVILSAPFIDRRVRAAEKAPVLEPEELLELKIGAPQAAPHPAWALKAALLLFGLTGLVSMSYQVLWTRAYLITLGSSTYSFTLVLTAVLIGIALGSALISAFIKHIARPLFALALTQFGVVASASLSFFVLDRVPLWLFERVRETVSSASEIYLFQFGLVALVVFLPSFLQGMSFPLILRAVTSRAARTGEDVGNAYAFNTTGAILGSFAAGFILLPWLGMARAIGAMILTNLLIALLFSLLELRLHRSAPKITALSLAFLSAGALFFFAPPIDQARLTSGVFRVHVARDMMTPQSFQRRNPEILYFKDGLTATTSVERHGDALVLKANGKPEASDGADMATQVMVGLLPFIFRSGWEDLPLGEEEAAMIGFGSGVTAGASLQWPLKSLEVVEIEAAMVEASAFFNHVNHRPLEDPRHRLIESDGRNYLEYTPRTFDVIISEPSNPWIAGVSSLFTLEFFLRVREKLNPGGVYAQWVQLYELRPENVRRVFATFLKAFPHVHAFSSKAKSTDLILIGSDRPLPFPPEGLQRAWEVDPLRAELQRIGLEEIEELYGLLFMTHRELLDFAEGAEINTDDNGLLEFSAPRDLIFYQEGQQFFANFYYQTPLHGDPRPYLSGWPEDFSPSQGAALARAAWVAGKPVLSREILQDLRIDPAIDIENFPKEYHPVLSVLQASELDWSRFLEESAPLPKELREPLELARSRQWRRAARHLDKLNESGAIPTPSTFHLLYAQVLERRRRYNQAFQHYLLFTQSPQNAAPDSP